MITLVVCSCMLWADWALGLEQQILPVIECCGEAALNIEPDYIEFTYERAIAAPSVADATRDAAQFHAGFTDYWNSREDLAEVSCQVGEARVVNLATCVAEGTVQVRVGVSVILALAPLGTGVERDTALAEIMGKMAEATASWQLTPCEIRGGVTQTEDAEAEALRAALEQAYPHAEAVAAALQGEAVSVQRVEVQKVDWETVQQGQPVTPLICRASVRVVYGFGR